MAETMTNPTTYERAVERAAKEIDERITGAPFWTHETSREVVQAVLAAIGFHPDSVIVPREPSEAMHQAFFDARDEYEQIKRDKVFPRPTICCFIYEAMLAAAQEGKEGEG